MKRGWYCWTHNNHSNRKLFYVEGNYYYYWRGAYVPIYNMYHIRWLEHARDLYNVDACYLGTHFEAAWIMCQLKAS